MTHVTTLRAWPGPLAGVLAVGAGVAVGTAAAEVLAVPSPLEAVGNRAIELTPRPLKEWAVETFGTADKVVLVAGMAVVLLVLVAAIGHLGARRPRLGLTLFAVLGLVAVAAAVPDDAVLPAVVTLGVGVGALALLLRPTQAEAPAGFDRRAFLRTALGVSAAIALGGAVSGLVTNRGAESRAGVRLPRASVPASPVPVGADVDLEGVSSFITSNRDFYRIDTALRVPQVPVEGYTLRIHGLVDRELELSFEDLLDERLLERRITLTCVSNEVGGPYVGNAAWLGVPVRDLLARAGVQPGADAVKSTSADGMTIGTPLSALTDDQRDALVAVGMNGVPLPLEHGFPVRMVVPGLYGYVSATKWLIDLEVTRFADFEAYWTPRGYAAEAPIKLSSRIDVPKSFQTFEPGLVRAGGVAWAQHTGIDRVEVRVDEGPWQDATLADEDGLDTWRLWSWQGDRVPAGSHKLTVRATDRDGTTQTSARAPIAPDGSTGWHSVQFRVE